MIRSSAGRAARRAAFAVLVVAAAAGTGSAGGAPPPGRLGDLAPIAPGPARVGEGVLRALEDRGEVAVLVTLRQATAGAAGERVSRDEIAAARERALARAGGGVDLGMAYTAVPAFTAIVTRDGLDELRSAPDVLSVDLPLKFRRALSDGVSLIRADQAHVEGLTGAGVTVAVIDSGIDAAHPDLADDVVGEACFVRLDDGTGGCPNGSRRQIGPGTAPDGDGHGTAVAGIVTSRGVAAPRGVAPDAKVLAIKVFPSDPESQSDSRDTLAALDWLLVSRPDVRVVNLSLGSDPIEGPCDASSAGNTAYAAAFAALRARGVTVVASSGNEGSTTGISPPACVSGAISVGAVYDADLGTYATDICTDSSTAADKVACYSNGGLGLDVLAPGPGTLAPKPGGGTDDFGGTSAAAPFVTGVAALLLQARPGLGPEQLESALSQSGVSVLDGRTGRTAPRVDARAALDLLPTLPDAAPRQTLPAGASAFADAAGDGGAGADLTDVRVSSSGNGLLTFAISVPNRSSLGPADAFQIVVDADRNPATGSSTGADYTIAVYPAGSPEVHRWSGGRWQIHGLLDDAVFAGATLTLTLDELRIGGGGDFGFWVVSAANGIGADAAPASGSWPHPNHALGVTRSGTGSGTVSGGGANGVDCGARCNAALARGASVTLTAAATAGSVFLGWDGACSGTAGCALTMDGPKNVSARFEALRRLTVTLAGTGSGSVASAPGGISCGTACAADFPHGVPLSLTATAADGSRFEGWSGGCSGAGDCSLTPAGATALTATFADVQAPRATALPSSGRRGRLAALRYRLVDNSGRAAAQVTVQAGARRLASLSRPAGRATGGQSSVAWRIPRSAAGRALRFCVHPVDAGGNRGPASCARLAVR